MSSMYDQGELLSIDIDELGIRPADWNDDHQDFKNSLNEFFGTGKTADISIYSAEVQIFNNGTKLTTDGNESSMHDDEDTNNYEIDPETGEKIFRKPVFISDTYTSNSASPNKWFEEYLSTIETSANQFSSNKTTTIDNSDLFLENFPESFFENFDEQNDTDWFANIIDLEETTDNNLSTNTMTSNQSIDINENISNDIIATSSSSNSLSFDNTTNNEIEPKHPLMISIDDESSNYSDMTFYETKSEKIELDADFQSPNAFRRASGRSHNQKQQDEEALRQYNIPLALTDITHSSTDEYNRHMARLTYLSTEQLQIIKDIRRRGKNKIAAQNCRKRKANSVETLSDEVEELKRVKHELEERKRAILEQINETRLQYEHLHRQVLPDRQLPPAIVVK